MYTHKPYALKSTFFEPCLTVFVPCLGHDHSWMDKTVDCTKYNSLVHFMEEAFSEHKGLPMYQSMGKTLTFDRVNQLANHFAAYLQRHTNLVAGSSVAIQLPNLLQYPIAVLGMLRAGLVVVNVNPQYTSHEMADQFKDAGVRGIIILENFAHKLAEILPQTDVQTVIVSKVGDILGGFKGRLLNFVIKHVKCLVPKYHLPGAIAFKEVLSKGAEATLTPVALTRNDPAFLQYTGGTTGVPKAIVLSHGNLLANFAQMDCITRFFLKEKAERVVMPLPFYHIFGLGGIFMMAQLGAQALLVPNPRAISKLITALKKYKPTCLIGIQTLFEKLMIHRKFKALSFSSFKLTIAGGMQTDASVREKWELATGGKLVEGYGLTECSPGVCISIAYGDYIPLPNTSIMIADEAGRPLPYGQTGEIYVQGPQVARAYWKQAEETKKAFCDGWFKTGDLGLMDEKGVMHIVDRKKDMINISGFNVYPNEIEQVVKGHPKVLEVGAIGIEDIGLKEAIKVCIVKKDATLTADEILAYCKKKLTNYKIPRYVEFRKSLPKSSIGKILRKLLK